MGWERILPLEIYSNFKTWKQIVIFSVKRSDFNFQAYKKNHSIITHVSHLCEIA